MRPDAKHLRSGYALPAVLLFLAFAFAAWAVFFHSSSSAIQIEQARNRRASRGTFSAVAEATAMRLLQTGIPPSDPYACKLELTDSGQTRYLLLTFSKVSAARWSVAVTQTEADNTVPDCPSTFFREPDMVADLSAAAISYSEIDLSWNDVAYDNGYLVERSADGVSGWTQIGTTAKNVCSYADTGLTFGTTYFYRVHATNAAGEGPYSLVASSSTTNPVPTPPSGMIASTISQTQINLTWTDNSFNETGFRVQRSDDGVSGWADIGTVATNATSLSDTGLTADTTYYYRVQAYNGTGDSAFSNVANAATLPNAPSGPTGLGATGVTSSEIDLTWTDNSTSETGFKIERSPDDSTWAQITTVGPDVASYHNTGLSTATTYYYRVRATNTGGDSAYSNTATGATLPTAPIAPSTLVATAASSTQIDLAWADNSSNETGFKVERSPDGSSWTQINTTAAGATSYSSTGLTAATTYYYRVRASNTGGDSGYTNTANTATLPTAPTAPSGLAASAASASQIDLTWTDNSSNETGFKVERSPDNSTWTQITTTPADATSYSSTGLSANTLYYYRVRATNTGGDSSYTSSASDTTLPNAPTAPSGLGAVAVNSSNINLTWTDNSNNETGFKIERSPDNATWTQIGTNSAGDTTYTSSGLSASTTYYYRVRAYNTGGNSSYTSSANATTTAIPAIPTGLAAQVMSSTSVKLTWTDNSNNETGFRVQRSTNNSSWTTVTTTSANATTYTVTGLTHNQQYYFRIRASGASGNSANTSSVTATP